MTLTKSTSIHEVLSLENDCQRCGHCCSYGTGALLDTDIKRIAGFLNIAEKDLKEKYLEEIEKFNTKRFRPKAIKEKGRPYGRCVFLQDKDICKIHPVKPIECRIGNCSSYGEKIAIWFTLNYFVDPDDPESIRQWAVYLKTHPTIPGGNLTDLVPDRERLGKMLDYSELRRR